MTNPRQLAPTVGPAHGGIEFLKGSVIGSEKFAIFPVQQAGVEKFTSMMSSSIKSDQVFCGGRYEIEIVLGLQIMRLPHAP